MINFDQVPDQVQEFQLVPEGLRKFAIAEITLAPASNGGKNLVLKANDIETGISSMNFIFYEDANGNSVPFGLSKIKKLLNAVGRMPEGSVSMEIIPTLLAGGTFQAKIEHSKPNAQNKVYANINDWDSVAPIEAVVVSTPVTEPPVETLTAPQVNEQVQQAVINDEIDI